MIYKLSDYLDLRPEDAREQWRRIAVRVPARRQETFLPVEVLLCLALFLQVNPHKFGGGNIAKAPAAVHALAKLFVRTPGSITSKMLNLDGSRTNSGRHEIELYLRAGPGTQQLLALYMLCITSAWEIGLSEAQVPDFLSLWDNNGALVLLGQEEISQPELELAMVDYQEQMRHFEAQHSFSVNDTTRLVEQRVRVGQHRFASDVLNSYGAGCAFCDFTPRSLPNSKLIVASHIKPWARSNARERLDPRNGVAACPTHDAAFDTGLITLTDDLRVLRSERLQKSIREDLGVSMWFGEHALRERIRAPYQPYTPSPAFLDYHRTSIYKG